MLALSYALAFYLQKGGGHQQVEVFEFNLNDLHNETEKLSHFLERGLDDISESVEKFKEIKETVS
jgi:hypothetical protein